ncbi:MAG: MerC domain-containing protein [Gammaproteobacteria bacterium]|jgi:cytochrome c biogenesis factor
MEKVQIQKNLDSVAISVSVLCILHCLLTPLLLIAIPVMSSTILAEELFHKLLVALVLPVSLFALSIGCRRHRDRKVLLLGSIGLFFLVAVAFFGHELLGELGEKIATVISGLILAVGHFRNYRLCRNDQCDI